MGRRARATWSFCSVERRRETTRCNANAPPTRSQSGPLSWPESERICARTRLPHQGGVPVSSTGSRPRVPRARPPHAGAAESPWRKDHAGDRCGLAALRRGRFDFVQSGSEVRALRAARRALLRSRRGTLIELVAADLDIRDETRRDLTLCGIGERVAICPSLGPVGGLAAGLMGVEPAPIKPRAVCARQADTLASVV